MIGILGYTYIKVVGSPIRCQVRLKILVYMAS